MTDWQKKSVLVAVLAFLPAYFLSTWRLEGQLNALDQLVEKEKLLQQSDLKLLEVCKETGLDDSDNYSSNAVLCRQAQDRSKLQEKTFEKLEADRHHMQKGRYWYFLWVWLLVNAAGQLVLRWSTIQKKLEA